MKVELLDARSATASADPGRAVVVEINRHANWELGRAQALELAKQLVAAVNDSFEAHTPKGTFDALDALSDMASDLEG